MTDNRILLSLNEAVEILGLSNKTVRKMVLDGDLKGVRLGGKIMVKRDSIDQLLSDKEIAKPE